jgi:hypothetical protein
LAQLTPAKKQKAHSAPNTSGPQFQSSSTMSLLQLVFVLHLALLLLATHNHEVPPHSHADRDEIRRRAAADFRRLFLDLGGKLRGNRPLCPFHTDKTPSASIRRGWFKCFVCDLHLDPIAFVARMLKTDFLGALRYLGDRYAVPIQQLKFSPGERRRWAAERRRLDYDRPYAEFWRRAAVKLADESLAAMKAELFGMPGFDPREILLMETERARLVKLSGAQLVDEYHSWLNHDPELTVSMVSVAQDRTEAERRALERHWIMMHQLPAPLWVSLIALHGTEAHS